MKPIVLPVLAVGLLAACEQAEPPPSPPRAAVVMTVGKDAGSGFQVYSGEVRARHETDLAFRIGGQLVSRKVSLGERVHKGQVLAQIDAQDVQLANSSARAQVAAAEAEVALAKSEYERARSMLAQKFVSASMVDTRRTQLEAAESRLKQAQAQAGVQGNQLGYTALLAERDGVITAAPVDAGQVVAAGQTVLRLADPREREVLIWVSETRVASIKRGQPAFVRPWNAQDKTYPATVREVAASADAATRTYAVRVSVPRAGEDLPLGATAVVAFAQAEEGGLSLPLPAVVRNGDAAHVWVVDADNAVHRRVIDVALWRDEVAVLRSGLQSGERVVVGGAHVLAEGMRIQPVEKDAPVALDIRR